METVSVCVASYNTFSKGQEVLGRTITSIVNSIKYLCALRNDVKVIISWVDDGSDDGTLSEVKRLRELQDEGIKENFFVNSIQINKGPSFCRNLAAILYDSDYICLFDSDDEMYKEHLSTCLEIINIKTPEGKKVGIGSTTLDTDYELHPEWINRISGTSPITKIIRRDVWEFLEGMPVENIFRTSGGEDAAFLVYALKYFAASATKKVTAKYWNYSNSCLDNQLDRFKASPEEAAKEQKALLPQEFEIVRNYLIKNKIEYLKQKAKIYNCAEKFKDLLAKFD